MFLRYTGWQLQIASGIAISVSRVNRNLLYSLIIESMISDAALICTSRHFICRLFQTKHDSIINFNMYLLD